MIEINNNNVNTEKFYFMTDSKKKENLITI